MSQQNSYPGALGAGTIFEDDLVRIVQSPTKVGLLSISMDSSKLAPKHLNCRNQHDFEGLFYLENDEFYMGEFDIYKFWELKKWLDEIKNEETERFKVESVINACLQIYYHELYNTTSRRVLLETAVKEGVLYYEKTFVVRVSLPSGVAGSLGKLSFVVAGPNESLRDD